MPAVGLGASSTLPSPLAGEGLGARGPGLPSTRPTYPPVPQPPAVPVQPPAPPVPPSANDALFAMLKAATTPVPQQPQPLPPPAAGPFSDSGRFSPPAVMPSLSPAPAAMNPYASPAEAYSSQTSIRQHRRSSRPAVGGRRPRVHVLVEDLADVPLRIGARLPRDAPRRGHRLAALVCRLRNGDRLPRPGGLATAVAGRRGEFRQCRRPAAGPGGRTAGDWTVGRLHVCGCRVRHTDLCRRLSPGADAAGRGEPEF